MEAHKIVRLDEARRQGEAQNQLHLKLQGK